MTLEEGIERELYRVEANRDMADGFHTDENIYSKEEEAFRNREDYHRQLAEWLMKLKIYESDDEICKYCTHTHDGDYCNMCKHNSIFVNHFDLEVNADDTNRCEN